MNLMSMLSNLACQSKAEKMKPILGRYRYDSPAVPMVLRASRTGYANEWGSTEPCTYLIVCMTKNFPYILSNFLSNVISEEHV